MQSLFVEAVHIARGLFQATRDPFRGYPYSPTVLVTNARGRGLDDPSLPRQTHALFPLVIEIRDTAEGRLPVGMSEL
eukprot:676985-Pyramimonas_sp.AAC.1